MSSVVMEVHRSDDGTWEAMERHLLDSEDLLSIDTSCYPTEKGDVWISGKIRPLTIFVEDEDDGFILLAEAYAAA